MYFSFSVIFSFLAIFQKHMMDIAKMMSEIDASELSLFDFKQEVQQYESYRAVSRKVKDRIDKLYKRTRDGNCLVHGDLHSGNVIRDKNGQSIVVLDFEFCKRGSKYVNYATVIAANCLERGDYRRAIKGKKIDEFKLKPYIALQCICFWLWYKDNGEDENSERMKYWMKVFKKGGEIK